VPADSLFGPQRAADLVRQSAPQTDWDRFSPAEPILTVIDDREYWQVRVVPEDNSGIAYVAFVDARSGDVDSFEQTDTITQFLAGETPVETPTETEPSETTAETPTVIVQRVAENGTVIETMTVYDDESVEIRNTNKRHRWHRKHDRQNARKLDASAHHGHSNTVCDSDIFSLLCDREIGPQYNASCWIEAFTTVLLGVTKKLLWATTRRDNYLV